MNIEHWIDIEHWIGQSSKVKLAIFLSICKILITLISLSNLTKEVIFWINSHSKHLPQTPLGYFYLWLCRVKMSYMS